LLNTAIVASTDANSGTTLSISMPQRDIITIPVQPSVRKLYGGRNRLANEAEILQFRGA